MVEFLFRCPNTGRLVQGWSADDVQSSENGSESVSCLACTQLHFVNWATGKVLRSEVRESDRRRHRSLPIPPPVARRRSHPLPMPTLSLDHPAVGHKLVADV